MLLQRVVAMDYKRWTRLRQAHNLLHTRKARQFRKIISLCMGCPSLEISFAKTTLCCPEVMSNSSFFKTLKTETTGILLPSGVLNNFLQNLQMHSRCISPFQPFLANSSRACVNFIDIPNQSSVNDWHMWYYLTGKITRGRDDGIKRMSTGSLLPPLRSPPDCTQLAPLADFSFRPKPHLGACSQATMETTYALR